MTTDEWHGPPAEQPKPARKGLRMLHYAVITLALLSVAIYIRPDQFGVSVYNVSKITGAAWMAYFVDTALFANAWARLNEDEPRDVITAARMMARAVIFFGCVWGMGSIG
jgi:hypothetical protein